MWAVWAVKTRCAFDACDNKNCIHGACIFPVDDYSSVTIVLRLHVDCYDRMRTVTIQGPSVTIQGPSVTIQGPTVTIQVRLLRCSTRLLDVFCCSFFSGVGSSSSRGLKSRHWLKLVFNMSSTYSHDIPLSASLSLLASSRDWTPACLPAFRVRNSSISSSDSHRQIYNIELASNRVGEKMH